MKLTESLLKQLWYLAIDSSLEVFAQNKAPTLLAAQPEAPELGEALRELVRLKDLKDRLETSLSYVGRGIDEQEYALTKAWEAARAALAQKAVPIAVEPMTTAERGVIEGLLALCSTVFQALDNSEEREGDDGREHAIDATWFDPVSEALDKLEALPDDQPGYTMDAPAKAEWALRNMLATPPAPIASAEEAVPVAWEFSSPEGERPKLAFLTSKPSTREHYESQGWRVLPLYTPPAAAQPSRAEVLETWRPIETAPRTGRTLLLGYPNALGKWRTVRGQWMSEAYIAESWEEPDDAEAGWYETSAESDDVPNCWPITPTHWMALPTPPGETQ